VAGRLRAAVDHRVVRPLDPWVVRRFHRMFYGSGAWQRSRWLGVPVLKNPLDLFVYQEIVAETRPELIVETGTHSGGSALYLASLCDLVGCGEVVTVDVNPVKPSYPEHPRLTFLGGRSSTDPDLVAEVRARGAGKRAMVVLDSDHAREHVAAELEAYAPLVGDGCYLVVEDSNVGVLVRHDLPPGPLEAIPPFLARHPEFTVDGSRERFMLTFNPRGYLRRTAPLPGA
jgi:cephalosporin hydroxylase